MSQDLLIKMVSVGDKNGVGKGHTYYTRFNNKNKKNPSQKYEAKKFNPISQTHCVYFFTKLQQELFLTLRIQGFKVKRCEAYRVYDEHLFTEDNAVDGGFRRASYSLP
jgi:ribosomal protein L33